MVTSNLEYLMCFYMFLMKTESLVALKILYEEHFEHSKLEAFIPHKELDWNF